MNRRGFLQLLGLATAGVVVPELVEPRRKLWAVSRSAPVPELGPKTMAASIPIELGRGARVDFEIYDEVLTDERREEILRAMDAMKLNRGSEPMRLAITEPPKFDAKEFKCTFALDPIPDYPIDMLRGLRRTPIPGIKVIGPRPDPMRAVYHMPSGHEVDERTVEEWHESDSTKPLHEHLGLTWDQYADWLERG